MGTSQSCKSRGETLFKAFDSRRFDDYASVLIAKLGHPCDRSHRAKPTRKVDEFPADTSTLTTRTAKGASKQVMRSFQAMRGNIRAYTSYTLNAFRQMAGANVKKVTLEFGIKVAGEAGVLYVTKGAADANLKIMLECSLLRKLQLQRPERTLSRPRSDSV